jgi:hypothetical protein
MQTKTKIIMAIATLAIVVSCYFISTIGNQTVKIGQALTDSDGRHYILSHVEIGDSGDQAPNFYWIHFDSIYGEYVFFLGDGDPYTFTLGSTTFELQRLFIESPQELQSITVKEVA